MEEVVHSVPDALRKVLCIKRAVKILPFAYCLNFHQPGETTKAKDHMVSNLTKDNQSAW